MSVLPSPPKGYGVFADEHIKKGEFIIEYVGEVVSVTEFNKRWNIYTNSDNVHSYLMNCSGMFIDATKKGNNARFINHSCDPNCFVDKWDVLGKPCIGIFSKKHIERGQEITYNYKFSDDR